MAMNCPGSDTRKLKASLHPCPSCGYEVEMFSDEMRRRCRNCGAMVFKESAPSCAWYCVAARECLGPERWDAFLEQCGDEHPVAARAAPKDPSGSAA